MGNKFIIKSQEIIISPTVCENLTVVTDGNKIIISTEFWQDLLAESLAGKQSESTKELYKQLGVKNETN